LYAVWGRPTRRSPSRWKRKFQSMPKFRLGEKPTRLSVTSVEFANTGSLSLTSSLMR
jgi:hypothetical protein